MKNLILGALLVFSLTLFAQKTTRSKLKADFAGATMEMPLTVADTIPLDSGQVTVSGYEKSLRATVESFFVTNHTADTLSQVGLTIEYRDMSGRQLHQRTETVKLSLPPSSTRMARISSWDKQKVWYYYLTVPTRTRNYQSTPYRVTITPVFAIKDP